MLRPNADNACFHFISRRTPQTAATPKPHLGAQPHPVHCFPRLWTICSISSSGIINRLSPIRHRSHQDAWWNMPVIAEVEWNEEVLDRLLDDAAPESGVPRDKMDGDLQALAETEGIAYVRLDDEADGLATDDDVDVKDMERIDRIVPQLRSPRRCSRQRICLTLISLLASELYAEESGEPADFREQWQREVEMSPAITSTNPEARRARSTVFNTTTSPSAPPPPSESSDTRTSLHRHQQHIPL